VAPGVWRKLKRKPPEMNRSTILLLAVLLPLVACGQENRLSLDISASPFMGNKDAKVTIVEYSDYQCGHCARHFQTTFPMLKEHFIETGKLKYVLRNFPLESIHPQALKAAAAALCANEQQKYWEMHHRLFANPAQVDMRYMPEHAAAIRMDGVKFSRCLESEKYVSQVRRELQEGQQIGVEGTPTFLIGKTGDPKKFVPTESLIGAQPFAAFKQIIDALIE
jgi:protein-disulfide isomerase